MGGTETGVKDPCFELFLLQTLKCHAMVWQRGGGGGLSLPCLSGVYRQGEVSVKREERRIVLPETLPCLRCLPS